MVPILIDHLCVFFPVSEIPGRSHLIMLLDFICKSAMKQRIFT